MPFQKNMLSRFNVSKFMKEKKEIREQQAATHESIAEEKLKLSAAQAKLRRLKGKVSFTSSLLANSLFYQFNPNIHLHCTNSPN